MSELAERATAYPQIHACLPFLAKPWPCRITLGKCQCPCGASSHEEAPQTSANTSTSLNSTTPPNIGFPICSLNPINPDKPHKSRSARVQIANIHAQNPVYPINPLNPVLKKNKKTGHEPSPASHTQPRL